MAPWEGGGSCSPPLSGEPGPAPALSAGAAPAGGGGGEKEKEKKKKEEKRKKEEEEPSSAFPGREAGILCPGHGNGSGGVPESFWSPKILLETLKSLWDPSDRSGAPQILLEPPKSFWDPSGAPQIFLILLEPPKSSWITPNPSGTLQEPLKSF